MNRTSDRLILWAVILMVTDHFHLTNWAVGLLLALFLNWFLFSYLEGMTRFIALNKNTKPKQKE